MRLFALHDIEHVFFRQRLKVKSVGGIVIRTDRLGIAIDHDRFDAFFPQRHRRMDTTIIEFDALPDPIGSPAENDDFLPIGRAGPRIPFHTSNRDRAYGLQTPPRTYRPVYRCTAVCPVVLVDLCLRRDHAPAPEELRQTII